MTRSRSEATWIGRCSDVVFADPANHTVGPDGRYRYRWEVWIDGEPAVVGMDCTTVDEEGRTSRLDGFLGEFPPIEPE